MGASVQTHSEYFTTYVHLLVELHDLIRRGKGDDAEADDVRDEMDDPWRHLSPSELDLTEGLSADLYSIGVDRQPRGSLAAEEIAEWQQMIDAERWDTALEFLRRHESALPPDKVACMRGIAWGSLSQHVAAVEFFKEAVCLAPSDINYQILYLQALLRCQGSAQALPLVAQIVRESNDAAMLIKAAHVLVVRAEELPHDAAIAYWQQAIHVVQRADQLALKAPNDQVLPTMRVTGYMCLAHCYFRLGDLLKARDSINNALRLDPEHVPAQTWLQSLDQAASAHSDRQTIPTMPPFNSASIESTVCSIGHE